MKLWVTPQWLFDRLDEEFEFTLDACATEETAKCAAFYPPEEGADRTWWGRSVFVNPPYDDLGRWLAKARHECVRGVLVSAVLVPAKTDTKWWHEYAMRAFEIRFIKGRLLFGDERGRAPFPSAVVIYRSWGWPGEVHVSTIER